MYSQDKVDITLRVYHRCGFMTKIIRVLSYAALKNWWKLNIEFATASLHNSFHFLEAQSIIHDRLLGITT